MRLRGILFGASFASFLAPIASAAPQAASVVVAIRYLQSKGTSHSHLYLYRGDGKLTRQLTKDDSGQDIDPIFAPDGESIVFTREKEGEVAEIWRVDPRTAKATRLDAAPEWYNSAKSSPFFTNYEPEPKTPATDAAPTPAPEAENSDSPRTYAAPDGSVEVVAQRLADDEDDSVNGEGTGKHFLLCDRTSGTEVEMGTLPGFVGLWDVLHLRGQREQAFLFEGELRTVFFGLHLDSTEGDTVFALDLNRRELVRLSPNWAAPIPLPGEPAFLTVTYNRYVPIPGSKKTANCTFLERWDAQFTKVRYAREGTAALCYGASVFRPERTPVSLNFRRNAE